MAFPPLVRLSTCWDYSVPLLITILALVLLVFAGGVLWRKLKWATLIIVGIPFILTAVDYFVPGNQTNFRVTVYILYAFLLYTVAIFSKRN